MFAKLVQASAAALLFSSVSAHMEVNTPTPWGSGPGGPLNNSPLSGDGSDFPCKNIQRDGTSNIMAIGEPQTLSFKGGATHGGGSCQLALTTDLQPTANTKWMVIKSIEGGCPGDNPGNEGNDANALSQKSFPFTIPDGIEPGEHTWAWTWFNKVGVREMYMNCGSATIVGAKKKRYVPNGVSTVRRQTSFPDIYVANIGNGCATVEGSDYHYPNPGDAVQEAGKGPYMTLEACGNSGSGPAQPPKQGAGNGSGSQNGTGPQTGNGPQQGAGSESGTTPTTSSSTSVPTSISNNPATGNGNGNGLVTPGGSADTGVTPPSTTKPQPGVFAPGSPKDGSASPSGVASNPIGSGSSAPSSGAPGTLGSPCTNEGYYTCSDDGSILRCASGYLQPQPVSQGMKFSCADQGATLSMESLS